MTFIARQADRSLNHVQAWSASHLHTLQVATANAHLRGLDFSDARLASVLNYLGNEQRWQEFERELNQRLLRADPLAVQRRTLTLLGWDAMVYEWLAVDPATLLPNERTLRFNIQHSIFPRFLPHPRLLCYTPPMSDVPKPQSKIQNLKSKIAVRLPAPYQQALAAVIGAAQRGGVGVYLVGGLVRDLLLDRPNLDLDVAVEGDAITLATAVAAQLGINNDAAASPLTNSKLKTQNSKLITSHFGTAKLTWPGDDPPTTLVYLDFATTRQESYAAPAALPTVSFVADIGTDLRRRDFTINALALRLADYTLVDPYGGLADLSAGLTRVLHPASFVDDPTRIFRAVRYEQRLGFAIEPITLGLLRDAVSGGLIERLSPDRVRHELEKILREERAPAMFARLTELGILAAVDPALLWDGQLRHQTEAVAVAESPSDCPLLYLLLLTYRLSDDQRQRVSDRLNLDADTRTLMQQTHQLRARLPDLLRAARRSDIYNLLHLYPDVALLATTYALAPYGGANVNALAAALGKIDLYRRELAAIKPELGGNYLAALGLPPSKAYTAILAELRRAKLDGEAPTREDEAALLQRLAAEAI